MTAVVIAGAAVLLGGGRYFAEGSRAVRARVQGAARSAVRPERCREHCSRACAAASDCCCRSRRRRSSRRSSARSRSAAGRSARGVDAEFSRLNPIAGFGRIASVNGLVELLKALAKFAVVAGVAGLLLWRFGGDFLALGTLTLEAAIAPRGLARRRLPRGARRELAARRRGRRAVSVLAPPPAAAHDEAGGEGRAQGDRGPSRGPVANSQLAARACHRRMMADVPKADVVAMNPTHYAVALRYDAGNDEGAARRREGRRSHRVPDPPRGRSAQRADLRAPAVRARAVPHERDRQGNLAAVVRRRRASADLHLSAHGPRRRRPKGAARRARRKGKPKMPVLVDRRRAHASRSAVAGRCDGVKA